MDLAPIIERLRDQVPQLRQVAGGAAFATLPESGPVASPSAWVLPFAERAQDRGLIGRVAQRVDLNFGVVLAVRNVADARGAAALLDLDPLRSAVRAALLGWMPDGAAIPIEYHSGALLKIAAGWLWWQDQYQTGFDIRSA